MRTLDKRVEIAQDAKNKLKQRYTIVNTYD